LEAELPRHAVERDRGLDQAVFRLDEIEEAGNAEFGGEFLGAHRNSFPRGPSSPIAARRRHHEIWHASVGFAD